MPNFEEMRGLNAGVLVFAGAIVLILLSSFFFARKKGTFLKFFIFCLAFDALMLLSEGFLLVVEGQEEYKYLMNYFMYSSMISGFVASTFWVYSIIAYVKEKTSNTSYFFGYGALMVSVIQTILMITSMFNDNFIYINDNFKVSYTEEYMIIDALNILMMFIKLSMLLTYRKPLLQTSKTTYVFFIVFTVLSIGFEWFWKTTPAYLINTLLAAIFYFMFSNELSHMIELKNEELAESKIKIMLSQIQPHFLYNTLTSIASLCDLDPQEAKKVTINFSNYLRGNINSLSSAEMIPFEKEIDHIICYLEIEKVRFKERVNFEFDLKVKNFVVPPLSIQPLVENAVKHGICKKKEGGLVQISSYEEEKYYVVEIKDNGVGFNFNDKLDDSRKHIGLENVETRLSKMCNGYLTVDSEIEKGTVIKVYYPKNKS